MPVSGRAGPLLRLPAGAAEQPPAGFLYPGGGDLHPAELPAGHHRGGDRRNLQTQPELFQQAVQGGHRLHAPGIHYPPAADQGGGADADDRRSHRGYRPAVRLSQPAALFPGVQEAIRPAAQGVAEGK